MFREFVRLCRELELFGRELVAVDGTRIKAVNSRERNFTKAKLEKALAESDERLSRYLDRLDEADGQDEGGTGGGEVEHIQEKIAAESGQNRAPHIDPPRPGAPSAGLPAPNRQITWDRRKSCCPKPPSPPPPEFSHGLDRVAAGKPVLVPQTLENPMRRVPLLARHVRIRVRLQDRVDDAGEPVQLRPPYRLRPPIPSYARFWVTA